MTTKIDNFLDAFLQMGIPGYDCLVMKNGECVYRRMGGFSDYDRKISVRGDEVYNIYSCSKPVTCVAALQLFEQGKFRLEDKLSDYMPEFEKVVVKTPDGVIPAKNPILIKDLFTMTSGLDYYLGFTADLRKTTEGKCPTREVIRELAKIPLSFAPGKEWQYGLSHDVIAALVEVISGECFGEYVRKNIFEPLGMNNSTFLLDDKNLDTICAQYDYNDETKEFMEIGPCIQNFKVGSLYESGGAGMISTVNDYIKFLEALRVGDVILKKETIDLMTTNMLTDEQGKTYWSILNYGYGLGVRTPKENHTFDFGWGGAAGAFLMVDRAHNITAFYAQHVLHSPNGNLRTLLPQLITKTFADAEVHLTSTLPEEVLKKFL